MGTESFTTLLTRVGFLSGVSPFMNLNRSGTSKSFTTLLANVWLLSGVNSSMHSEETWPKECLPTILAFVRLVCVTTVCYHVRFNTRAGDEGFPTFFTFIGPLPSVGSSVDLDGTGTTEGLPTLLTHVGPLPSVNSFMNSKRTRRAEHFTTMLALIDSLSNVCPFMCLKGLVIDEGLPTVLTPVGVFSSVSPFMSLKGFEVTEGGPTFLTFISLLSTLKPVKLMPRVRSDMSSEGRTKHEAFSTYTTIIWFSSSSYLGHASVWNLAEAFSMLSNLFTFIESLYHITSYIFLLDSVLICNILVFQFTPHRGQVCHGFPHHISVEFLLRRTQHSPLFLRESDTHVFKGHRIHCRSSQIQALPYPQGNRTSPSPSPDLCDVPRMCITWPRPFPALRVSPFLIDQVA